MAFAGTFGAAANLVPFGLISSKQYGAASGYDANGNLQFTTPGGTVITPQRINDLFIAADTDILAALVDNTDDGSAADTGVFATEAPAANEHSLPANFGPGRGNWTADLLGQLRVDIMEAVNTVAAITNAGGPHIRARGLAAGDVTVVVKNMSEVALASGLFRLQMEHSIQP